MPSALAIKCCQSYDQHHLADQSKPSPLQEAQYCLKLMLWCISPNWPQGQNMLKSERTCCVELCTAPGGCHWQYNAAAGRLGDSFLQLDTACYLRMQVTVPILIVISLWDHTVMGD